MAAYARAKARIFANQGSGCLAVVGDQEGLASLVPAGPRLLVFGRTSRAQARVHGSMVCWQGREYHLEGSPLAHGPGPLNAAAAPVRIGGHGTDPVVVKACYVCPSPIAWRWG